MSHLRGPVLITANHPNSFLDAIIIATVFNKPIHFLARGDAFHKPWHNVLLRTLHMFPVYRMSEGKEFLGLNAAAFENSRNVLRKNGIVLIFIEGICVNKHELQPFKKGAARIAASCWKEGIPLQVLPLGIGYSSFHKIGKSVLIQTGELLNQKDLMPLEEEAKNYTNFNQVLFKKMNDLITIPAFNPDKSSFTRIPGKIGTIINLPLYALISSFVLKKTRNTVFYDSVLFGLLFFCYPIYLLIIGLILSIFSVPTFLVLFLLCLHPIFAYLATSTKTHTIS
jgi:1-acyl-sn-glycerol-3-phosphate acyltransferase